MSAGPASLGVHVAPMASVSGGVAALIILGWYWRRLGRPGIPVPRRRLRRSSLAVMMVGVPVVVVALSFADPRRHALLWGGCWFVVLFLVFASIGFALLDVLLSFRLLYEDRTSLRREHRRALQEALREHREGTREDES